MATLTVGFHEAEGGGEDQLASGACQPLDRTLGIGPFGHVLDIGGLDLVAERLVDRLAGDVMLVGPAEIADRPDIDEADLEPVRGLGVAPPPATSGKNSPARAVPRKYSRLFILLLRVDTMGSSTFLRL